MSRRITFFEGWSWFKLNNLGLALGTNLNFCTSVAKGLKLKVRKFWGPNPTFVEVTGKKLVGAAFLPLPPNLNRVNAFIFKLSAFILFRQLQFACWIWFSHCMFPSIQLDICKIKRRSNNFYTFDKMVTGRSCLLSYKIFKKNGVIFALILKER